MTIRTLPGTHPGGDKNKTKFVIKYNWVSPSGRGAGERLLSRLLNNASLTMLPVLGQVPKPERTQNRDIRWSVHTTLRFSSRKSPILGVWAAPAASNTITEGGERSPTFWTGFWGRRGRPNHNNCRFPAGPKTMHKKPKCTGSELCLRPKY